MGDGNLVAHTDDLSAAIEIFGGPWPQVVDSQIDRADPIFRVTQHGETGRTAGGVDERRDDATMNSGPGRVPDELVLPWDDERGLALVQFHRADTKHAVEGDVVFEEANEGLETRIDVEF